MSRQDVIVVGAGVIGCAVAHALASEGLAVRVVEARRPGQGATQASAGVLAPYVEGHDSDTLCELGRRSLDLFDAFVDRVAREAGERVFYDRCGTVEVAYTDEEAARLQRESATLTRAGVDARWVDPRSLRDLEPGATSDARGAVHVPLHGFVAASQLTRALAGAAARKGATFLGDVHVSAITPATGNGLVVHTSAGTFEAERVVLAGGSWSGRIRIAGAAEVPVKPIRGQLLDLAWPVPRLTHIVWGRECYIVPWPDGTVLVGATVEDVGFDERATVVGVRGLLDAALKLVPALTDAEFRGVRVGLRPAAPHALPIVGASSAVPGLVYATGHYRNGVLLTPLTAELVSNVVLGAGEDPALEALSPSRFSKL